MSADTLTLRPSAAPPAALPGDGTTAGAAALAGMSTPPTACLPRIDADELSRRISALPALPRAVLQALEVLRDEQAGLADCAERLAVDPALAARALRLANSAFYGLSGRITTLRDAVQLLGRHTLATLLTAAAVMAQFKDSAMTLRCHGIYWRHALAVALAAQALARERQVDADTAFTAGLLHDIGRLALAAYFPAAHHEVLAHVHEADVETLAAERAVLGLDHCEIGARLARQWRFPPSVSAAIAGHHRPGQPALAEATPARAEAGASRGSATPSSAVSAASHGPADRGDAGSGRPARPSRLAAPDLADLVHVADGIAHGLDLDHLTHEMVPSPDLTAWDRVGLQNDEAQRLFAQVEQGVVAFSQALGL